MKIWKKLLWVAVGSVSLHTWALYEEKTEIKKGESLPEAVPGEFVLQARSTKAEKSLAEALSGAGLKLVERVNPTVGVYRVQVKDQKMIQNTKAFRDAVIEKVSRLSNVKVIEPNFIYRTLDVPVSKIATPNDPKFGDLWAMENTGQRDSAGTAGKVGADIKAKAAWDISTGSKNIVVAVVDTGVDYTHPDLKDNIWSDPTDASVHGYNAITDALDPKDDNNHGTHCSGTIGGMGNNGEGVTGVNWHVSIMGSKFLDSSGSGTLANAIKAIDWATTHGARLMSNSWGGGGFSQTLLDAITRADAKGITFIAAAGNDSSNNDGTPSYPASYNSPNIIAVAASNNLDKISSFSNYGKTSVAIMAPGENIVSSVIGGKYDSYSGTSMATPHVSGSVALLLSKEPNLTSSQIRQRLMTSSDKFRSYRAKLASAGRLNLYNLMANITIPAPVSIPDTAWVAPIAKSLASAHPYKNGDTYHFEISEPNAKFIRVHFLKVDTEKGYDFIKVTDQNGEEVDNLSGAAAGVWSLEAQGSKINVDFKADDTVNGWGFEVDSYSWTDFNGKVSSAAAR